MTVRQNRFSVGDIIDGKYEVVRVLPAGGMGELYKVRHIHLNDFRAVKVLKSQMLTDTTQKQRFLREAKIAASIKHPNLASLFDFSSLPDGSYYMVQELIDGVTLIETINSGEVFDVPSILRVGQQVLGGLASLHEEGIIHRDISPDNLMLAKTNSGSTTIKIIDLGIAKPIDAGEGLTNAGFFVGKLHYASPEQAGMIEPGEKVDHRTDLYSLGVVLYQLVARRMPFAADNPQRYFLKQVSEEVAPINRPDEPPVVPVELEQFILRMLRKNRKERFASATEALNELVMISARLSTVAPSFVPDDTSRSVPQNQPLGGSPATDAGEDTDLFGSPLDAPVFSGSLAATPLGHSPPDRTTAELPLINSFPSPERTDEFHLPQDASSGSIPEATGEYSIDEQTSDRTAADAGSEDPPPAAPGMSDQARAILAADQQATTVQPLQSLPTQIDMPSADAYPSTVVQPVIQPGPYGDSPVSPKTMMEDDTVAGPSAPVTPSGTVVQDISGLEPGFAGTAGAPSAYTPPAGVPPRQATRRSGAIWVVVLLILLMFGAALFAALFFLPFSPFSGGGDETTIAEAGTSTGAPGTGLPVIPVETPSPTPEPTPMIDPLDLITQTAFSMGTTMGPDFVPTPTPRATARPRVTPRQTATPAPERPTPTPTPPPATPPPPREGQLVEQGSAGVTTARITRWSPPRYPRGAERQRAEGTTTLRVLVGPDGQVEDIRVSTSSGFKILDDEAINVARKSTFAPATKDGVRLRMWIPVRVTFQRP